MKFLYVRSAGSQLAVPASSVVGVYSTSQREVAIYFNSLGTKNRNSGRILLTGFGPNEEDEQVRVVENISKEIASDNGNMFVLLADTKENEFYDDKITGFSIRLA